MKMQIQMDEVIADEFKLLAKHNDITQKTLFEFIWLEFLRSGTPQIRAAKLSKLEKKA